VQSSTITVFFGWQQDRFTSGFCVHLEPQDQPHVSQIPAGLGLDNHVGPIAS